ncbi:glycosyltransferase family 39 protein [Candidatus Wolfebacteria bacterium]|nr:glycosyltransferase family 39 protein [Candidatus Wolfebacteria bacterium]
MRINFLSRGFVWLILFLIITGSFVLSFAASRQESAIMDELAHIPAGYGYVRFLDYRLNPEHPPLLKTLAGLPLLFGNFNFPLESRAWQKDINGQWETGAKFLYESGNDPDKIVNWARIGPLFMTLLFVVFIYVWAKELLGRWWALLPTLLFSFSPTVLAHGHYVTTDIAAAFGIFIATYFLIKYLMKPSRFNLLAAGLTFGIAELAKFSAVLLIPSFIFIVFVFYFWKFKEGIGSFWLIRIFTRALKALFKTISVLFFVFAIGYLLVYLVYAIFVWNYPMEKQVSDTESILTSFGDGPDPNRLTCDLTSDIPTARRIRCLAEINILMAKSKIFRPLAQYLLGVLMVMQRSSGGNTGYFLGEVSASGWWYYFPAVFALKEPLPSLVLVGLAFLFSLWHVIRKFKIKNSKLKIFSDYLGTNFAEFSMISFIILYWLYSVKSPLNIGVRHILPTVPFMYILATGAVKRWSGGIPKKIFIGALVIWYLMETLFAYPYFLSYFNQFGGGTLNGYRYVTDSNYDWGQDLKRLAEWVHEKNNDNDYDNDIDKIAVDYFGGGSPTYYLGDKAESWWSSKGNPKDYGIEWLAVSVNTIQGAKGKLHPGQERKPEDEYSWLKDPYNPYARAGTSIFIYKLQ